MIDEAHNKDYLRYRIDRSEELFQDTLLLAKNKSWRSCVNRLYYSSFHLVNALLFKHNIYAKSHDGLKTLFFQYFIKTQKINIEFGKLYSKLIDWRQESDYSVFVDFDKNDLDPLIENVQQLNKAIIKLL